MLKALSWLGSSRSDVGNFPADARRRTGYELYLIQSGLEPVAKFSEAIYVLHAFEKKTRKTPNAEIELARSRLRELLGSRRGGGRTQE
jgi:phage-related protein